MGTINPDAAEEVRAAQDALYDYLAAQLSDLDGAPLARQDRPSIDARMKATTFVRTFEAVNKNFSGYSPCCSWRFRRAQRSWIPTTWRIRAWR